MEVQNVLYLTKVNEKLLVIVHVDQNTIQVTRFEYTGCRLKALAS